jgi:hypothetical protein
LTGGDTPLEYTTVYNVENGVLRRYLGVFDHTDGKFHNQINFTDSIFDDYTSVNSYGERIYAPEVLRGTDGQWHAMLYNYRTQQWDEKYTKAGTATGPRDYGWEIFETWYFNGQTPTLPKFRAEYLQIYNGSGSFNNVTSPKWGNEMWNQMKYPFSWIAPYYAWVAN